MSHTASLSPPQRLAQHLFWCGHIGVVGVDTVLGGWAAGDLLGVREGASFHLCQDAFLVQLGFQKAGIAIKLHQVENLRSKHHTAQSQKEQSSLLLGTHEQVLFWKSVFQPILPGHSDANSPGILLLSAACPFCHSSRSGVTELMLVKSMGRLRPPAVTLAGLHFLRTWKAVGSRVSVAWGRSLFYSRVM